MSPSKTKVRAPRKAAKQERPAHEAVRVRWERKNVGLFGVGLGSVALGYLLLSRGDITLAPILLVAGYCVLIPLAFIL